MSDDMELVRDYAAGRSEPAFETIVSRYIHLVYSAALRQVRDPHLAEEVTQAVFIILARKAGAFGPKTILPSWLHRTACFAARDALRTDLRRRQREQEAFMQAPSNESSSTSDEVWSQISPMLDAALARLSEKDHQAVVLRFLENKSLSEVGQALGVQEDAARMRVNRALERLRKFFVKHGIVSTTAALGAMISANSVQAAPSALAAATTAAAIAKGAAASGSTVVLVKGALKLMAWAKAQTAVAVGTSVILAAGTVAVAVKDLSRTGASLPVAASSPVDEFLSGSGPSAKWSQAPPALMVRPTHFSQLNGSACREDFPSHGERVKAAGRNAPFDWLMTAAYGFDKTRMIPPKYLPRTNFDYLATLPDCPAKAFQAEIEKEVGFIAHPEMRDVDVLLLKVKTPAAPGLRVDVTTNHSLRWTYGAQAYCATNMPISDLRAFLEDTIFHRPVIDQTGLTNKYDLDLAWEPAGHEAVKECLLEQLGLELVPARQRLEMLVIEPSTNSSKATQLAQVSPSSLGESFWNEPRLDLLPPVLLLRPTRFGFDNMSAYEDADAMGRVRLRFKYESLEYLLAAACDFKVAGGYCTWPSRMVLPPDLPRQRYDLLLTVPDAQEALQKEIRNRFHLTVRREVREVDALVIRDKAAEAPADSNKPTIPRNPVVSSAARGQPALWRQLPLWLIARNIEGQQGKPVLVQTASTNRFDLSIQPVLKDGKLVYDEEALKRAFRDQLGLEITSSREPVQMLVVERARD